MDECASVLLRFPPEEKNAAFLSDDVFDRQIKIHAGRVQKLFKEYSALLASHSTELLSRLDPAVHTYSYLALLNTIIPTDSALYASVQPVIANNIVAFLVTFDVRQVRYLGSAFTQLFTAVGSGKIIPAPIAVTLLARALETIDPTGYMLTSNHLTLAKLAYHTQNAAAALPVLSKDIVFFPGMATHRESDLLCSLSLSPPSYISKDTGLTLPIKSTQVLEFDYILGLLYNSVRDWTSSHAAFARVLSHPVRDNGVSKIMVAAHKYWVLTGLLLFGKVAVSPPHTSGTVTRVCASINRVYVQIAELFQLPSAAIMWREVSQARELLTADGSLSVVKEVLAAHSKWQVAHLRDVYSTITIADIRKTLQTSPEAVMTATGEAAGLECPNFDVSEVEVAALVQGMIDSGMILAVIRPESPAAPAYLEFLTEEETMTESQFAKRIAKVAARVQALKPLHKTTDEQISLNQDYIRQHIRDLKWEKDNSEDDGLSGSLHGFGHSFDPDLDEDLMTDGPGGIL